MSILEINIFKTLSKQATQAARDDYATATARAGALFNTQREIEQKAGLINHSFSGYMERVEGYLADGRPGLAGGELAQAYNVLHYDLFLYYPNPALTKLRPPEAYFEEAAREVATLAGGFISRAQPVNAGRLVGGFVRNAVYPPHTSAESTDGLLKALGPLFQKIIDAVPADQSEAFLVGFKEMAAARAGAEVEAFLRPLLTEKMGLPEAMVDQIIQAGQESHAPAEPGWFKRWMALLNIGRAKLAHAK